MHYDVNENNFLINSTFKSAGRGSIYADKVKVGSSYCSISYSNGILTFTS